MAKDSFWAPLPDVESIRTPLAIMNEQAVALSELTNRLLEGAVVQSSNNPGNIAATLQIIAPSLNGFRVSMVSISHGIQLYPLVLIDHMTSAQVSVPSEEVFNQELKEILGSEKTRQIIASLLVQIKSAGAHA